MGTTRSITKQGDTLINYPNLYININFIYFINYTIKAIAHPDNLMSNNIDRIQKNMMNRNPKRKKQKFIFIKKNL